jgi:hypothetical protein
MSGIGSELAEILGKKTFHAAAIAREREGEARIKVHVFEIYALNELEASQFVLPLAFQHGLEVYTVLQVVPKGAPFLRIG